MWLSLEWPTPRVESGLLAARGCSHTHFLAGKGYRAGATGLGLLGPGRRLADLAIAWLTYSRSILSFHLSPFTPYC